MRWLWTFLLVSLSLTVSVTQQSYVIRFENNRYSGIVVSINEDVPENPKIVQQLKDIFTNASKILYKATHNRAFFGDVVIEIPKTWSVDPSYQYAPGKSLFPNAAFRIAKGNPKFKDTPYTMQASGCGHPGQYVHLTPAFVLNEDGDMSQKYGNLAKQIVHEWAHYRYGVFDEYGKAGDKKYPSFYIDDSGNVRPTSCRENIKGWLSSSDGGPCSILEGELLPDDDCRFIPDEDQDNVTSSLMYSAFITSIDQFCDNSTENLHNIKAPNKHNTLCNYKSTWKVISEHKDFIDQNRPSTKEANQTVPNFRVIHRKRNEKSKFVLALDVSGSMRKNDRILTLRAAASRFIHHRVQDGSYLGIVSFSKDTEQLMSVTKVDKDTRELMAKQLPRETYSETAIGKALLESIEMLRWKSPEGAVIILITDGEENIHPSINTVLPKVIESKVIVDTIAIGTKASEKLENLAVQTGGKVFYFPDHTDSPTALDEAFIALSTEYSSEDSQNLMIMSESKNVSSSTPAQGSVIIDQTVGINTKFLFTGSNIRDLDVSVIDPNGKVYRPNPTNSRLYDSTQSVVFDIKDAEAGIWTYQVKENFEMTARSKFDVSLTTEPREKDPIKIKTWMLSQKVEFPHRAAIFAEIQKAQKPVILANVEAFVTGPNGDRFNVTLHDNGVGADINKEDGIYSAYFAAYAGNGRYSVSVTAKNVGEAFLIEKPIVSAAPAFPDVPNINKIKQRIPKNNFALDEFVVIKTRTHGRPREVIAPALNFQRASMVGSFKLEKWDKKKEDTIPPIRITDLKALYILDDSDHMLVRLFWTSPMNDQDVHRNHGVDIRASARIDLLHSNFLGGYQIKEKDVVSGSVQAGTYGLKNLTVKLPSDRIPGREEQKLMNVYFALKHDDHNGNVAEISNIAYATVGVAPPVKQVKLDPPDVLESDNMPKIVGIVAGCVCGTVLLAVALVIVVKAFKKSRTNDLEDSY